MTEYRKHPEAISRQASLRFIHRNDMEAEGYGAYLDQVEDIQ